MARLKILVAGDPASIHANRFVNLLQEIGYEVRVFQSEHYYSQEEHLHDTVVYVSNFGLSGSWEPPINGNTLIAYSSGEMSFDQWNGRTFRTVRRISQFVRRKFFSQTAGYRRAEDLPPRASHLRRVVERWRPDVIISLKMQNDGYTVAQALSSPAGPRPKWVHFTWGTDLEFFGKHPDYAPAHIPRIRQVLESCDFLISDCRRDQRQAREFGFAGVSLGECIAPGGFDLAELSALRAEGPVRDVILVKGREGGLVGKALNAIKALERIAPALAGYRIRVMMATAPVRAAVEELAKRRGLDCEVLPRLPYRDLLRYFGSSRLAVAASDVDGTPSFLIEAMAMGALPVPSDMESIREWVEDGVNGLLFPVDDVAALAACIERGLKDDTFVSAAAERNWALTRERTDRNRIRARVKELIEDRVLGVSAPAKAAA